MPQGPKPSPLIKPFVVLALPGMYLFYKYNQYKRKRKENATRRLAERELQHLNNKIEKLLSKLEESEPEPATCQEEECVICINAKATMQTAPCGHQVVCRKCFVKTIQIAVSQRLLPLRCVICRAKILRLKTGPILPTSASGYSMASRSSSVPQSDSLYSVSSGGSSISSMSCSSNGSKGSSCCGAHCLGAYPRQPLTSAIKKSQQHAMKMRLQDYCRPERNHVNRLPPIKELPGQSPLHNTPPASTRIRCAQKIVTQLELPLLKSKGYKYEKLSQEEEETDMATTLATEKGKRWWSDKRRDRTKSEERIDNKKNEIVEKQMELKEKLAKTEKQKKSVNQTLKTKEKLYEKSVAKKMLTPCPIQSNILSEVINTIASFKDVRGSPTSKIVKRVMASRKLELNNPLIQIKKALKTGLKSGLIREVGGNFKLGLDQNEYAAYRKFLRTESKLPFSSRIKAKQTRRSRRRSKRRRRNLPRRRKMGLGDSIKEVNEIPAQKEKRQARKRKICTLRGDRSSKNINFEGDAPDEKSLKNQNKDNQLDNDEDAFNRKHHESDSSNSRHSDYEMQQCKMETNNRNPFKD